MSKTEVYHTAIIGGGIAGLYSAMKLAEKIPTGEKIAIFEASNRLGGRIETGSLGRGTEPGIREDFNCEFGPMRYELGIQPLLDRLLRVNLNLESNLQEFPDFQTATVTWPKYELEEDEKDKDGKDYNALELMKLALIRIFEGTHWESEGDKTDPNHWEHDNWLSELYKSDKYDKIRKNASIKINQNEEHKLWELGFWNVLSEVLSHQAILKIRDTGNFYHLIPENPNAAEWIVFWLRGIAPKPLGQLYTLQSGSKAITEEMEKLLKEGRYYKDKIDFFTGHKLTSFKTTNNQLIELQFENKVLVPPAQHVIFAIPYKPLQKLAHLFGSKTQKNLKAVFGFPLLKVFFTVDNPWWTSTTAVHTGAGTLPTRELHYYYNERTKQGMIMLYMDRPNTEYWKIYVKGEFHEQAEVNGDERLKNRFAKYLAADLSTDFSILPINTDSKIYKELQKGDLEALTEEIKIQLGDFAIRDWSRPPYGAACHTWRPGVKAWEVLDYLKGFRQDEQEEGIKNMHVCGEAYCDYNGFIEGSLRSAENVVKTIELSMKEDLVGVGT